MCVCVCVCVCCVCLVFCQLNNKYFSICLVSLFVSLSSFKLLKCRFSTHIF